MEKQWKQWETYLGGFKITSDGDCIHNIKRRLLLGRKAVTNLDSVLKSRDITLNWCFWTVVLEKTLESPLDCKEINPEYFLEGLRLKLKLQYFGHLMWRADSLEKTLMLGKIEGRGNRQGKQGEKMGKQWKQCQTLFFWAPKSLQMVTAAMKLKDAYSLEGKLWPT